MRLLSLEEAFEGLEDPRDDKGKKYPLIDIIYLSIYGTLCGKTNFVAMAHFLKLREAVLTEKLGLANGVPSHDVFSDVFRRLDVQKFLECFALWISSAVAEVTNGEAILEGEGVTFDGEQFAIDGKAIIAATRKSMKGKIPYIVSAYACKLGISVCQREIGPKANEITEIPKLIEMMDIENCTVTIDAIGTQKKIMDLICNKGGHFCLQVKRNHPTEFDSIKLYFEDQLKRQERGWEHADIDVAAGILKGHGRIETRTYYTISEEDDVRNVVPEWDKVHCLGMVVRVREELGEPRKVSVETQFHAMDVARSAVEYAGLARGHWREENSLHYVLDVYMGEDRCTSRADNAIPNLALLRKFCLNIIRQVKGSHSVEHVMDEFAFDPDKFLPFLFERMPLAIANGGAAS